MEPASAMLTWLPDVMRRPATSANWPFTKTFEESVTPPDATARVLVMVRLLTVAGKPPVVCAAVPLKI